MKGTWRENILNYFTFEGLRFFFLTEVSYVFHMKDTKDFEFSFFNGEYFVFCVFDIADLADRPRI